MNPERLKDPICAPQPELALGAVLHEVVCTECCFDDPHFKAFVAENATGILCSYCRVRRGAPMCAVVEKISACVDCEWTDPAVYDSGAVLPEWDFVDGRGMIKGLGLTAPSGRFTEDVCVALGGPWIRPRPPAGIPWFTEFRMDRWRAFCDKTKHQRRYFFLSGGKKDRRPKKFSGEDFFFQEDMLQKIAQIAKRAALCRPMPKGTPVYRARVGKHTSESRLISPPPEKAIFSNRMSPAGVPMFYGALDSSTAFQETYDSAIGRVGDVVTIARFCLARDLPVLDLSRQMLDMPSIFSQEGQDTRADFAFLLRIAQDIAQPVKKDGREHIEYVPTQILTEYLREFSGRDDTLPKAGGLLFFSARRQGGVSCVLFPDVENGRDKNLALERVFQHQRKPRGKWEEIRRK